MLNSISWQEFLTWLTLLAGGYYLISILLLYSQEITTFFKSKPSNQSTITKLPTSSVMGGAVQDNDEAQTKRSAITVSEEIAFAEDDNQPEEIQTVRPAKKSDDLLVGTIADALEEIKTVVNAIADAGHDREQTSSLFQALLSRYSQLEGTTYQEAITLFICERVKTQLRFSLSSAEVNAWWKSE